MASCSDGTSRSMLVGHSRRCPVNPDDPDNLRRYDPSEDDLTFVPEQVARQVADTLERIRCAQRPVLFAGTGVRLANALPEFTEVARRLRIPVVTAWTHDLIASDDELFCGRPGTIGERAGNVAVQNSDVLLVLGSRLNIPADEL